MRREHYAGAKRPTHKVRRLESEAVREEHRADAMDPNDP